MTARRSSSGRARSAKVHYYVSPCGSDRWNGTLPAPSADGRDGPLATMAKAQALVRAAIRKGLRAPVRVQLRGGTYALTSPLVFMPADSGTAACPVVYEAYPGERPVLSGGRKITGWRTETVNGVACWVADLPKVREGKWYFTQLFVNGRRRWRPRLPREGYYRFAGLPGFKETGKWLQGPNQAEFEPGDLKAWRHRDDVRIVALQLWFEAHHRIRGLDLKKHLVKFRARSLGNLRDEKLPGKLARYFVENVFEALGEPGDWYLDRQAGRLYYVPCEGETPERAEVVAPYLGSLVEIRGTEQRSAGHLRFENLAFQHADWDYADEDPGSIQAEFKVPGAVVLEHAEGCVFYGCDISHVAQYGIEVRTGSSANRIVACHLHDLGAGGVRIGHEWMDRVNETTTAIQKVGRKPRPMATTVSDCTIHDGSLIFLSAIGIWIGNSSRNRIEHNHIFNLNYTGISCGWTWGYARTATVENTIAFNHIHHINWNRILSDNGGIYTLGTQPGTVLWNNVIHHVGKYGYGGWGIYPDEGSSEMRIEDNIVFLTDEAGFSTHYGRDNLVQNNIFALSGLAAPGKTSHVNPGKQEKHRTTVFERNIVLFEEGSLGQRDWSPVNYVFRNNVFWNGGTPMDLGGGTTLSDWQALGQFEGCVCADPLFADPAAGDFALREDSPAWPLGFRPIDASAAGPRDSARRPLSYEKWRWKDAVPREIVRTRIDPAKGNRLKLTVENAGQVASSGRVRIKVGSMDGLRNIPGRDTLAFRNLDPGKHLSADFGTGPMPEGNWAWVETETQGRGLVPTLSLLHVPAPRWSISRLEQVPDVRDVARVLADLAPRSLCWFRKAVAEVRAAVAGDHLVLHAMVEDRNLCRGKERWNGSCIELFTASAAARQAGAKANIRQIFLVPPAGGRRGEAAMADGARQCLAPAVQHLFRLTRQGYEVSVVVPLSLLRVDSSDEFLMEIVVSTTRQSAVRAALFGAANAYRDAAGYGTVTVG